MDVGRFLGRFPPFDELPDDELTRLAGSAEVEFFPAGASILEQSGKPSEFLYAVRSGAVEVRFGGRIADLLGEGEVFGEFSLVSERGPLATIHAHEDTLCYAIHRDAALEILGTPGGMAFLVGATGRRIRGVQERTDAGHWALGGLTPVSSLIARPPVMCSPETSVEDAARIMAEERVSSLLVILPAEIGIVTDRDFRSRVLAARRSPATPVREVMTSPAQSVPADTPAAEALLLMLEGGFHHLPVRSSDDLIGLVSSTDLMGLGRDSPFALRTSIDRSSNGSDALAAARRLPEVVGALVEAGVTAVDVGRVVSMTIDALTDRLLVFGLERLGQPPCPWAWLALGSGARREQALHTDQDHALVLQPDEGDTQKVDGYFADLAEGVTEGLEQAGLPRCNGDAMAVNVALRRSVGGWEDRFRRWMADPGVEGSVLTSIMFDFRRVSGPLEIESALNDVVATAPSFPQFVRHLSRRALDERAPTGFFRDLVVEAKGEHAGALDIKHRGITIIGNLARAYAVGAGLTAKSTLARLDAAASARVIDDDTRRDLAEAFRLLWKVRLQHQADQVLAGIDPDDFVNPATIGPVARGSLKEAFRVIRKAQETLAATLGVTPP
jgi:CBS domain-containing protein